MLSRCITHPLKHSSFTPFCLVKIVGCRFSSINYEKMLKNYLLVQKASKKPKSIIENKETAQLVHKSAIELVNLEKSFEEGNVCCFFISFYFIMN